MDPTQAVNRIAAVAALRRPPVGTVFLVPNDHYFFLNSDVPAVRIKRGRSGSWYTVHPDDKEGLLVFVNDRMHDRPKCIVLTDVQPTVAIAKEQAPTK